MKSVVFWCEFPSRVKWEVLNEVDFQCEIYFACRTLDEFRKWEGKVKNRDIMAGAWPVLSKREGYWFSGYSSKSSIDKLKEFTGTNMKIDVEPPIFLGKLGFLAAARYFSRLTHKGRNNAYLGSTIKELESKGKVIVSTFPFPDFVLKRFGGEIKSTHKNMFVYRSVICFPFDKILDVYYSWFVRRKLRDGSASYFAIGCFGQGVFGNERIFSRLSDLEREVNYIKNMGVDNLAVFELSALTRKKDYKKWFDAVKCFLD